MKNLAKNLAKDLAKALAAGLLTACTTVAILSAFERYEIVPRPVVIAQRDGSAEVRCAAGYLPVTSEARLEVDSMEGLRHFTCRHVSQSEARLIERQPAGSHQWLIMGVDPAKVCPSCRHEVAR